MTFIVTLIFNGNLFFLRSTTWTTENVRATRFATQDEAHAAIRKALGFIKGGTRNLKNIRIIEG